jgi:hypothetical protein
MKITRTKKNLVLALALANGFLAAAQSNNPPGPEDYTRFSSFITQRNIFDPNRYPHNARTQRRQTYRPTWVNHSAPTFTLVGTMSYEKGMFAFFDGNNSDLRKVLSESGDIAGYNVTEVTLTGVILQTADKKETVRMKIGEAMRQEGDRWQPVESVETSADTSSEENAAPAAAENASGSEASPAPSPAIAANDILKKLMQQREQELK